MIKKFDELGGDKQKEALAALKKHNKALGIELIVFLLSVIGANLLASALGDLVMGDVTPTTKGLYYFVVSFVNSFFFYQKFRAKAKTNDDMLKKTLIEISDRQ